MPLLLTGKKFHNDLKQNYCLAMFAPLEGGYETRLLRRMRAKGYKTYITSARGLGDPEVFLLKLHGIRPPHLGHQSVGRNGALGEVQQVIPQASELFNENDKNKLLWLLEGQVLSQSELESLITICNEENKLHIVHEDFLASDGKLNFDSSVLQFEKWAFDLHGLKAVEVLDAAGSDVFLAFVTNRFPCSSSGDGA